MDLYQVPGYRPSFMSFITTRKKNYCHTSQRCKTETCFHVVIVSGCFDSITVPENLRLNDREESILWYENSLFRMFLVFTVARHTPL